MTNVNELVVDGVMFSAEFSRNFRRGSGSFSEDSNVPSPTHSRSSSSGNVYGMHAMGSPYAHPPVTMRPLHLSDSSALTVIRRVCLCVLFL